MTDDKGRIQLRGIHKSFGDFEALKDVNLDIAAREFFALLGPSGSGKSTTLRVIAGLETPDSGTMTVMVSTSPMRRRANGTQPWCSKTMRFIRI